MSLSRHIHLAAATGEIRTAVFEDRPHVVVPVVALIEGIIHAINVSNPELVLASEFGRSPQGWDGRPVLANHPQRNGERISANDPRSLGSRIGHVFNTRVVGKKLLMEAWIDVERARQQGGDAIRVLERVQAGEMVEVSVGAFVVPDEKPGTWNGRRFLAIWREITPDHLALLPEGTTGACSISMGCGTPRAAECRVLEDALDKDEQMPCACHEGDADLEALLDQLEARDAAGFNKAAYMTEYNARKKGGGVATSGVAAQLPASSPSQIEKMKQDVQRGVNIDKPDKPGGFSIKTLPSNINHSVQHPGGQEYNVVKKHENRGGAYVAHHVNAVTKKKTHIGSSPSPEGIGDKINQHADTHAAIAYGKKQGRHSAGGGKMTKQERIAALIETGRTPFVEEDAEKLEALSEGLLKNLESAAGIAEPAPAEPLTKEKVFAAFPELKAMEASYVRSQEEKQASLLQTLEELKQTVYSPEELKAMPLEALEKVVRLGQSGAPKSTNVISFAGAGQPRAAAGSEDVIPAAPDLAAAIRTARGKA